MNGDLLVSIIMPVYNAADYLSISIGSVLKQEYRNFELLLVDDGSTDGSGEICDEYQRLDPRVRVIHKKNEGICKTRNKGLCEARGELIAFIDNDDEIDSGLLSDNIELLRKYKADWVKFGKRELMYHNNILIKRRETNWKKKVLSGDDIIANLLELRAKSALTFVWDSLFLKSVIEKHNLRFDEKFKRGMEDIDFCERYAMVSNRMIINDKCYYNHYTRLGYSTSSRYTSDVIELSLYLLDKSNKRYKLIEEKIGEKYTDNINYYTIITRQIIVNMCQKINSRSDVTLRQKADEMLKIWKSESLIDYKNTKKSIDVLKENMKLGVYHYMFSRRHMYTLLLMDNMTRKIVYKFRMIKKGA